MNFKDAYKDELELYNPEASAERLKEFKHQEERRKDIKSIPYFIGAILLVLFIWWLCTERTVKVSKTYEGYFISEEHLLTKGEASPPEGAYTLTVNGNLTFSSKLSKKIVGLELTVTLKDKNGSIIFENYNESTGILGDLDSFNHAMIEWSYENGEFRDSLFYGILYFDNNLNDVVLYISDEYHLYSKKGPYYFVAPTKNSDEAYELYMDIFNFPNNTEK